MNETPASILDLWFGNDLESPEAVGKLSSRWFASDPAFDELISSRFKSLPDQALLGEFIDWTESPLGTLALVIALDQFPRNLHRGKAQAFAYDSAAVEISREAVSRRVDRELHPLQAVFLYLPFEHAENLDLQNHCVSLFQQLMERAPDPLMNSFASFLGYAERHHVVIEKFGRFPHRNDILGRRSTAEEIEYLRAGGDTFS